jgi:hypothetical protein
MNIALKEEVVISPRTFEIEVSSTEEISGNVSITPEMKDVSNP